jgi:hypothetical protein
LEQQRLELPSELPVPAPLLALPGFPLFHRRQPALHRLHRRRIPVGTDDE